MVAIAHAPFVGLMSFAAAIIVARPHVRPVSARATTRVAASHGRPAPSPGSRCIRRCRACQAWSVLQRDTPARTEASIADRVRAAIIVITLP
jgi:hypothetical protein